MLSRPLFIFFVLVALSAVASVSARGRGPGCIHITTCTNCTAKPGCGWCESTSQCFAGNSVGPGGNPKNCTEWFFGSCHIAECAALKTCLTCSADIFCGWCLTTKTCSAGTISGPILGSCPSGQFVTKGSSAKCPSASPSHSRTPSKSRSRIPASRSHIPASHTRTPSRSRIPPSRSHIPASRTRTPTPSHSHSHSRSHSNLPRRSSNPARKSNSNTPSNSVFILSSSPAFYLAPTTFFVGSFFAMATFALAKLF